MKTIQATLFEGGAAVELLGEYTEYDLAVDDAKTALSEVSPENSIIKVKASKKGKINQFDPQAVQWIVATDSDYHVELTIHVTGDDTGEEPSLIEEPVYVSKAPDAVISLTEAPMLDMTADVPIPHPSKLVSKKPKAQKYPDAVWVGEHRWWGCDQHTVLSWVETHPTEVVDNSIQMRKRGAKFALVCDKTTIWTCSYEEVAKYATDAANTKAQEVAVKAA